MRYQVIVSFGTGKDYVYEFAQADLDESTPDAARRWIDREFAALNGEPATAVGKVLIIDKILDIARDGGESRFVGGAAWATIFARYTALALGRETIRVDVEALSIVY